MKSTIDTESTLQEEVIAMPVVSVVGNCPPVEIAVSLSCYQDQKPLHPPMNVD